MGVLGPRISEFVAALLNGDTTLSCGIHEAGPVSWILIDKSSHESHAKKSVLVRADQPESLTPITECLSPSQEGILIPNFPKATIMISVRIWFSSTSAKHRITSRKIV